MENFLGEESATGRQPDEDAGPHFLDGLEQGQALHALVPRREFVEFVESLLHLSEVVTSLKQDFIDQFK